jgi:hypothetical protein
MLQALINGLRQARTDNDQRRLHLDAETWMTPAEVRRLLAYSFGLPPTTQAWLRVLAGLIDDADPTALRYERTRIVEPVDLFGDPAVPTAGKTLVLAYSSVHMRLFFPVSTILNYLPSRQVDLALIKDPKRYHFRLGIGPFADDFLAMHRWMETALRFADYGRVITLGVSMGGLTALRTTLMLQLERGVCLGGRVDWHIRRLRNAALENPPAFDALCDCWARRARRLICSYASEVAEDLRTVAMVERIVPIERVPVTSGEHNLLQAVRNAGRLRPFLAGLLGVEQSAAGAPA